MSGGILKSFRNRLWQLIFVLIVIGGSFSLAFSQMYGKNKVTYEQFSWSVLQTPHFDIYFYEGGENLAYFAAEVAEGAFRDYSEVFRWKIRRRISLLIYNSHSDFQQTNVTPEILTEGVAGFTEMFKNRAVVSFDGSYSDFEHVVRHELVHVFVNDLIYGGNITSVVTGAVALRIPLWMHEGLAEFLSIGWDDKADLILRDLTINKELPKFDDLNGYLAYKGGQSFYLFLAERYGLEKIGELWSQMKGKKAVSRGIKASLGMDVEELERKWQRWLKRRFWPDFENRSDIAEVAKALTDHEESSSYYNVSPAISPSGNMIAFMSDRDGYADIFLISALDGKILKKLVKGQRTPELEELKWLNPRLSWSPDGKQIVLAAKSKNKDALFFVTVKTGKHRKISFKDVEEIYTASWSPDGDKIAFIGLKDDRTDLYVYNMKTKTLFRLTNDQFPEFEPSWSPDGKKIVFVSQRGFSSDSVKTIEGTERLDFNSFEYHQKDIFVYDFDSGSIERLTDTPWDENYPIWANTRDAIIYTSNYNGVSNVFVMDLDTRETKAITNVVTGVYQLSLSRDDTKLAFAGYSGFGWDVYILSNPLDRPDVKDEIKPTQFAREEIKKFENPEGYRPVYKPYFVEAETTETKIVQQNRSFSRYIFAPGYQNWQPPALSSDSTETKKDSAETEEGYKIKKYKTKFTLDLVYSYAAYSNLWGAQGTTVFALSDILGNHRFIIGTEMYIDFENSDYYIRYDYLGKRADYSFIVFNSANFYASYYYFFYWRLRNYGADISISYPISIYERLEFGTTFYNVKQEAFEYYSGKRLYSYGLKTILPRVAWVYDNCLWGYFYPIDGWRARISYLASPRYYKSSLTFNTIEGDIRRYFKTSFLYSFGLRLAFGISNGKNPQRFFVGGEMGWLNAHFRRDPNYGDLQDLYFSEFVTPLRGARYYEKEGTRYFLFNAEFRYPFIKYLALGWPLPMVLGGIQGVTFLDVGSAWDGNKLHLFGRDVYRGYYMDDLVCGVGCGMRMFMGYFMLKIDVAWRYDMDRFYKPMWIFSLGTDW
ncbi:MAG TPA: hypothetical protein ENF20_01795 [Candidatus Marinimicrobia bacterium]|nr:hypothetical protein [Candidatus Neomarinimicrobiota bacterium]